MAATRSPLQSCLTAKHGAKNAQQAEQAAQFAQRQAQCLARASSAAARCSKWTLGLFALHVAAFWVWASLPPQQLSLALGGALSLCALWFVWELGRSSHWWLQMLEIQSLQAKLDALETLRQTAADLSKKQAQRRAASGLAQKTTQTEPSKG